MLDLSLPAISLLLLAALATGILHGAAGLAGGVVMTAILAHFIGIKTAMPVMSAALILSHASRVVFFHQHTNYRLVDRVLLIGTPFILLGTQIFVRLPPLWVELIFALFLAFSIPMKRWSAKHQFRTGPGLLGAASAVWGVLAGNVTGPGFFLAPFLLSTGINRLTFVGSLATITLGMNLAKALAFGYSGLLGAEELLLAGLIGLVTIPGNWMGKRILIQISDQRHGLMVEILTLLMILNFLYLAFE